MLFSCSNNETINKNEQTTVDLSEESHEIEFREPGQIPSEIDFFSKLLNSSKNESDLMELLKENKRLYGNTDFYNNIFELIASQLFNHEGFKNLDNEELSFLLEEFVNVPSNIVNIKNIPSLMTACSDAKLFDKSKFLSVFDGLIKKNKLEIEKIKWENTEVKNKKLKEIDDVQKSMYYLFRFVKNLSKKYLPKLVGCNFYFVAFFFYKKNQKMQSK